MDLLTKPELQSKETEKHTHFFRDRSKKIIKSTAVILTITIIAFILTIVLFVIVFTVGTIGPITSNRNNFLPINSQGEKGEKGDMGPPGPEGPQNNAQNPPLEEWQSGVCSFDGNMDGQSITHNFKFIQPFLSGNPIVAGSICCENPKTILTYSIHSVTDKGFSLTFYLSQKTNTNINFQYFAYIVKNLLNHTTQQREKFWQKELYREENSVERKNKKQIFFFFFFFLEKKKQKKNNSHKLT